MRATCFLMLALPALAACADAPPAAGQWHAITLGGFECGDNCYLRYLRDGEAQAAICAAPVCEAFQAEGALSPGLIGTAAQAKFSTSPQFDGAGNVMVADYLTIIELRTAAR